MNANNANEGSAETNTGAKREAKEERPKRSVLDILIYICGAFVVVGGLWLGYLGVFGHLKGQQVLGLWVLYGTLFFVLTGAFLYFHRQLHREEPTVVAPTDRAWLSVNVVSLGPLVFSGDNALLTARFIVTNTGNAPANGVIVKGEIIFPNPNDRQAILAEQGKLCRERGGRTDQVTIFPNKSETVDINYILTAKDMVAEAQVNQGYTMPMLIGCADYLINDVSHQTGFVYHVFALGPAGQGVLAIRMGRNVPAEQLVFVKFAFGGDYAN